MAVHPKYIAEYIAFQTVGFFVRLLPVEAMPKLGFGIVRWFYPVLASRRRAAMRNLRNAYPEKSESELEQIAFHSFQHITTTFLELLWHPRLTPEIIKDRVHIENLDLLLGLAEKKKGIVFLTAHHGSWELAVQALAVGTNLHYCAVAKKQSNPLVDRLITGWREAFGVKVALMGPGVREIVRTLREGGVIALIADQTAPIDSVPVEFFGRKVPTFEGPAVFSLKTGAPLVLGCAVRQEDGRYCMRLIHVPTDDLSGESGENIAVLTQRQVRMTEDLIRKHPEQWMWMHKRWKHVPDREGVSA